MQRSTRSQVGPGNGHNDPSEETRDEFIFEVQRELCYTKDWNQVLRLLNHAPSGCFLVAETLSLMVRMCPDVPVPVFERVVLHTGNDPHNENPPPLYLLYTGSFTQEMERKFLILLQWRPRDVMARIGRGREATVLHLLCSQNPLQPLHFRLIQAVLHACPLAAYVECQSAQLERAVKPLQLLAFNVAHAVDWLNMLVNVLEDFRTLRSFLGGTILHEVLMCVHGWHDRIERIALGDCFVAVARVAHSLCPDYLLANDRDVGTVLHLCATDDPDAIHPWTSTSEIARVALGLLDICPALATVEDVAGRLPLHLFCAKRFKESFDTVIIRLIDLYPAALRQRASVASECQAPLQLWAEVQWNVMYFYEGRDWHESGEEFAVATFWSVAAIIAERVGMEDITSAIANAGSREFDADAIAQAARMHGLVAFPIATFQFMIQAIYRFSCKWDIADDAGDFPLHKLVAPHRRIDPFRTPFRILSRLAERYLEPFIVATILSDDAGKFALHEAVANVQMWQRGAVAHSEIEEPYFEDWDDGEVGDVIRALTMGNANVLQCASPGNGLPPFATAASRHELEGCFELLRCCPDVVVFGRLGRLCTDGSSMVLE